jgi:hypothetical protein
MEIETTKIQERNRMDLSTAIRPAEKARNVVPGPTRRGKCLNEGRARMTVPTVDCPPDFRAKMTANEGPFNCSFPDFNPGQSDILLNMRA